jgi:2-haloacid dehalogenase
MTGATTQIQAVSLSSQKDNVQLFADVQALVFDVFGTVVDWRSGVAREATPFLARYAPGADPGAFADAWRRRYSPTMEEVRSGRRPFARLDVLHRESLEAVLSEFNMDPATVPSFELDTLNLAWHRLDPLPDSVPGLARLKERFIIAPLSNGNIRLMLDMAKRAGLPWDAILGAEIAHAYKPMPEAYLRTVDTLMPEQVCLVAAHNYDLAAARRGSTRPFAAAGRSGPAPPSVRPGRLESQTARDASKNAASAAPSPPPTHRPGSPRGHIRAGP